MSSPSNSSGESPQRAPAASKTSRNPVERAIVWIAILALIAVCGREALARFGYGNSLNRLQTVLGADDDGVVLTVDEANGLVSGFPTKEVDEANRVITYHWSGLLKDYGSIHLPYSPDNEILGLQTADAPPPVELPHSFADGDEEEDEDEEPDDAEESRGERPSRPGRPIAEPEGEPAESVNRE